ncbi:MAG: hypothetical protein ABSG67_11420 [Thermoguttaceae bacterium]|jgi:hypothetical protein
MDLDKSSVSEFSCGNDSVDNVAAKQIIATGYARPAYRGITVKAFTANSGLLYIGNNAGVSPTNSYQLPAGEQVTIPCDSPDKVWIIGSSGDPDDCKYNYVIA